MVSVGIQRSDGLVSLCRSRLTAFVMMKTTLPVPMHGLASALTNSAPALQARGSGSAKQSSQRHFLCVSRRTDCCSRPALTTGSGQCCIIARRHAIDTSDAPRRQVSSRQRHAASLRCQRRRRQYRLRCVLRLTSYGFRAASRCRAPARLGCRPMAAGVSTKPCERYRPARRALVLRDILQTAMFEAADRWLPQQPTLCGCSTALGCTSLDSPGVANPM